MYLDGSDDKPLDPIPRRGCLLDRPFHPADGRGHGDGPDQRPSRRVRLRLNGWRRGAGRPWARLAGRDAVAPHRWFARRALSGDALRSHAGLGPWSGAERRLRTRLTGRDAVAVAAGRPAPGATTIQSWVGPHGCAGGLLALQKVRGGGKGLLGGGSGGRDDLGGADAEEQPSLGDADAEAGGNLLWGESLLVQPVCP